MTLALAYSDQPSAPDADTVLFIHGFGHQRTVWRGTTDALPSRWRTLSVDLRGHGESPWSPEREYDLDDYARDLLALLDERGVETAHVVAHSLGGQIALLFAAAHPDRVRSVTLVDTGPALRSDGAAHVLGEVDDAFRSYPSIESYRRVLAQMHPFAEDGLLDEMSRSQLTRRFDGRFEPALDPGVLGDPTSQESDADASAREARLWENYWRLDVPVLVARGRLSSILREDVAQEMTEPTRGARRLVQFEGAGHAIMIDACRDFTTELGEFLESVAR